MRIAHYMPTYRGDCKYDAALSMSMVREWCALSEHMWYPLNSKSWIEDGRNQAMQAAIRGEFDLLLMQDADVGFDGPAVPDLLSKMREEGAAVCGAVVARRGRSNRENVNCWREVGCGLMLIDVESIALCLDAPYFRREINESGTRTRVGEDIGFCRAVRAADLGVAICDTIVTRHHGEVVLTAGSEQGESGNYVLTKTPLGEDDQGNGNGSLNAGQVR